jgi:hypothetical protein
LLYAGIADAVEMANGLYSLDAMQQPGSDS